MIKYLKKLNIAERIEMTTNASKLTPEVAEALVDAELDYIRCSIYSINQEKHEKITRNPIDIEQIKKNIQTLKSTIDKKNKNKPFIYVKMLESDILQENEDFLKIYSEFADEVAIEKKHNWLENSGQAARKVCPQPFKMVSIHFNGDVILCDPDWQGNTKVGNAISENIRDIWKGKKVREFWRMQLENRRFENPSCNNCSFFNDNYVFDNLDGLSPDCINKDI